MQGSKSTATQLSQLAIGNGVGARAARRLSDLLTKLAHSNQATRDRVSIALVVPLQTSLNGLREALLARPIAIADIPPDMKREWLAPDGRSRVEILPKGDPDDTKSLSSFVGAGACASSR